MKLRLRASVLCLSPDEKLLVVRLRDPATGKLYRLPPGGAIEKGESPRQAGAREVMEETGYPVRLERGFKMTLDYPFVWEGQVHACRTHFFRAQILGSPKPVVGAEKFLEGSEWLELSRLEDEWAFHPQLQQALIGIITDWIREKRRPVRKKA